MPARKQVWYWGGGFAVFFLFLWGMGSALVPFLIAAALAYFLDPLADRLQDLGLSRLAATIVIVFLVVVVLLGTLLAVIPLAVAQARDLISAAPDYIGQLQDFLSEHYPALLEADSGLVQGLSGFEETMRDQGVSMINNLLTQSLRLFDILLFLIITPVVTFFLLLDWDRMLARLDALLPLEHAPTIRRLAREIDSSLAGFVRGQLTVCLIAGTYYATALSLVGLQFGFVVGVIAGIVTFIPFVGAILGAILSIGLAIVQFWDQPVWILAVAAVFFAGQLVESNLLSPWLVGRYVGLHPVWLLFALSAFGAFFGFAGFLVAVPLAAAIGVLVRFGVERYQASSLYHGGAPPTELPETPPSRLREPAE